MGVKNVSPSEGRRFESLDGRIRKGSPLQFGKYLDFGEILSISIRTQGTIAGPAQNAVLHNVIVVADPFGFNRGVLNNRRVILPYNLGLRDSKIMCGTE